MKYLFLLVFATVFAAEDITGFWKSYNDEGRPQCVFGVYEHNGVHYGRIIGTFNDEGTMSDTIYKPLGRAAGVIGNPHTCGLDIIFGLQDNGSRFAGKILDPTKGKVYNCELWRELDGTLIVRGKLFIFGRNITWYPVSEGDFPKGFKMPDMKKFIPEIPNVY